MSVKGSCFTVHVFFLQQKKVSFKIHSSSPHFQGFVLSEMPPISCYDIRMSKMHKDVKNGIIILHFSEFLMPENI